MKKVILFMAGILASMMLNAQSRWSVTPEAGLVVNKENEGTSVTLGFKAGAGVLYQLKEGVGKKPSFGLKSGVYILMQKGGYHPMSWGNISTGGGFSMDYEKTNVESTRYYLQLPVMAHWGFKLCDDVRLKLAVGPYVAVGIGGRTNAYVSSSKYNIDEETGVGQYEYRNDYYRFGTFKGKTVNEEFGFEASPRLDWGGTASVGIAVKRISFTIGYDLAWGKYNKEQNKIAAAVISPEFTELERIKEHYEMSVNVIRLLYKLHISGVRKAEEWLPISLQMHSRKTSEYNFIKTTVLDKLQEYDRRYQSSLLDTLSAALRENSLEDAAERQHIHINTLRYRLGKIKEITQKNYFKMTDRYFLLLCIMIQRMEHEQL